MMENPKYPWSVQIEPVEGCCLACDFCGIYALNKYKKTQKRKRVQCMSIRTARQLAAGFADWMGKNHARRFEFAMRGEPLLHSDLPGIIALFRHNLPKAQLMITTNAIPIINGPPSLISNLFRAGTNYIALDAYEPNRDAIIQYGQQHAREIGVPFHDLYAEGWNVYQYRGHTERAIVLFDDIALNQGTDRRKKLCNHAGNVDYTKTAKYGITPLPAPLQKVCVNPFRELVIQYDGTVPVCCHDWLRECLVGVFPQQSLESIWEGDALNSIRSLLKRKARYRIPLCSRCDYDGGFRQGLITDPFPHEEEETLTMLYKATTEPYTPRQYKRTWI